MRILQINAVNAIASTGRICSAMHDFFSAHGHRCVTAYSKGPAVCPADEYRIGSEADAKLHGLLSRVSGEQGYFSKGATKKLLRFADEYAPDIVVLHNLHANYIHLPLLLRYLAKKEIATVAVLHDCWLFTGHCCHFAAAGCDRWQARCGNCPALKQYNVSWFRDTSAKLLQDKKDLFGAIGRLGVIGVSDWITGEARKAPVFRNAKRIERIYNWVDTDAFVPRDTEALRCALGLEGKKVILCAASGWSEKKGLGTVLLLAERLPADCRLLLVGNLPAQTKLGENIVHRPPNYDVQAYAAYYALADVLVQPSLEETFGLVAAESLSCGTPVVCFDSTANPELIGPGCGRVVPAGDVQALADAVASVLAAGKADCAQACRAFALRNFQMENNLSQYARLFETLCAMR